MIFINTDPLNRYDYINVFVSVYCRFLKFYKRASAKLILVVSAAVSRHPGQSIKHDYHHRKTGHVISLKGFL